MLCAPADKIIRVYSKNTDPAVIKALKYAFTQWSEKRHNCQPPGTPWRQPAAFQQQQQQQQPRPPPSIERLSGRAANAGGLAQTMFKSDNSSSNGNSNANGEVAHMGSGGRSRKRNLNSDMAAASQGSQGSEQQGKHARVSSQLPDIAEEDD
jgi:hypothetical protein